MERLEQQVKQLQEEFSEMRLRLQGAPETDETRWHREYAARVRVFLKLCEENPAKSIGTVDAAEDIRKIRDERVAHL